MVVRVHPERTRHIGEGAVALVAVKRVAPVVRDEQVEVAVVVVVADRAADPALLLGPARIVDASLRGVVDEAVSGVAPQRVRRARLVGEDDVEVAANCSVQRAAMGSTVIGRGTKVSDNSIAPVSANTTVIAIGWNIFPSMPVSAKIGR